MADTEQDRRQALRPFDPALIQSYLRGREIESAQLLAMGKSNTNYRLELADGEVCIVRLHNPQASVEREHYLLNLVRELVPVPRVLAKGANWSIHSFVEGAVLADAPEATRAAAEALARISSLCFATTGWIEPDGTITPFNFGNQKGFMETMLERNDVQTWLGADATKALRRIGVKERKLEQLDAGFCLVHGDFNPTNILIQNGAVAAILDWEFSHAGNRYMDIGNLLRNTPSAYHEQIEAGLATGGSPVPADWKKRAEFVDLGSHLEFLTTRRADAFKRQCVRWIYDFIVRYGND